MAMSCRVISASMRIRVYPPSRNRMQKSSSSATNAWVEAADLPAGVDADHHVAVREVDLADRQVPLDVGQAVVDRPLGIPLATTSGDQGDVGMLLEVTSATVQPAVDHLAVAVDEHDEADVRGDLEQPLETLVARRGRAVDRVRSTLTTSTPRDRASSTLPSVELPST